MHIGLRHSYYQAMISSGIGLMVLTAYVTTRSDLDVILQAPFDVLILTFSSITVIGGLINRTHCIRLNTDVDEGKFEKTKFKLVKEGKIAPRYYAILEEPVKGKLGEFDSFRLLPKRSHLKLFDGREISGDVVIDREKDIPIAVHFDEDFIFAKLSTLSAVPLPQMSSRARLEEKVGKCVIATIFFIAITLMLRNDIGYLAVKMNFNSAAQAAPETKVAIAKSLINSGAIFPDYDARRISSKMNASRYFIDAKDFDKAKEEIEDALQMTGHMSDPTIWKSYVLLGKGRALQAAEEYDQSEAALEKCLTILKKKHGYELLVPIIGWWHYQQATDSEIKGQALLSLATAYDVTKDDEKAEKTYKQLAFIEKVEDNLTGSELDLIRLGSFYRRRGDKEKAEVQFYKVVKQVEEVTKNKPKDTAAKLATLGYWAFERNEISCTEILFREALKLLEGTPGVSEVQIANDLNILAEVLFLQGSYNEAKPLFERALEILSKEKTSGEWTWSKLRLEDIKLKLNPEDYSEDVAFKVLKVRKAVFGEKSVRVSCPLHSLANFKKSKGDVEEASNLYAQAMELRAPSFGYNHPETHDLMHDYIEALRKQGNEASANKLQDKINQALSKPIPNL